MLQQCFRGENKKNNCHWDNFVRDCGCLEERLHEWKPRTMLKHTGHKQRHSAQHSTLAESKHEVITIMNHDLHPSEKSEKSMNPRNPTSDPLKHS